MYGRLDAMCATRSRPHCVAAAVWSAVIVCMQVGVLAVDIDNSRTKLGTTQQVQPSSIYKSMHRTRGPGAYFALLAARNVCGHCCRRRSNAHGTCASEQHRRDRGWSRGPLLCRACAASRSASLQTCCTLQLARGWPASVALLCTSSLRARSDAGVTHDGASRVKAEAALVKETWLSQDRRRPLTCGRCLKSNVDRIQQGIVSHHALAPCCLMTEFHEKRE